MWRKIEEGKRTLWSLKNIVVTEVQYKELLKIRKYLLDLTPSNCTPLMELDELCVLLKCPKVASLILYQTHSPHCSVKPLCSMLKVLDIAPRLIWVEHYICLYENSLTLNENLW